MPAAWYSVIVLNVKPEPKLEQDKDKTMTQTYCNTAEDCQWLRETHLKPENWNNELSMPDFKSFCMFGNEDCPAEILVYREKHPTITDKPVRAVLCDNGGYSFFKV